MTISVTRISKTSPSGCFRAIGIVVALAVVSGPRAMAADATAVAAVAPGDAEVLADRPLAVWRFEDEAGARKAVAERFAADAGVDRPNDTGSSGAVDAAALIAGAERLPAVASGVVVLGEPGPRPPRVTSFADRNTAALFGGAASRLVVGAKTPRFDEFQFTVSDAITLEAWVNLLAIDDGQHVSVIGKGRTGQKGFVADNQNWALRLEGRAGRALPGFLFRSGADQQSDDKLLHRWTADAGFAPASGWHHVAVSYTFGEPESLRAYVDGRPVAGTWDLGGATTAAPVVDDDEIWIGSSLKADEASSFVGFLDNVAIHRRALPPDRIADRWRVNEEAPAVEEPTLSPIPEEAVLYEIFEGVPDVDGWRIPLKQPSESFTRDAFALAELPLRYTDTGVRADRQLPLVLRARSRLLVPAGPQRIRVRARGEARVLFDGRQVATIKAVGRRTDGHEKMYVPDRSGPAGIRWVQPGDQEALVDVEGDGQWHTLHVEVKLGSKGRRPELGELSASIGPPDTVPHVLAARAEAEPVSLTDTGWAALEPRLAAENDAANTAARRAAAAKQADYWSRRHAEARRIISTGPGPTVPALPADRPDLAAATFNDVDRFINAALAEAGVLPAALADDEAFIRRLSLDVRGIIPTPEEITAFAADTSRDRREKLIDRFLADPRWADHWTAYWQDVLAENPNIVNPTLNNTGPFRFWIHESFLDRTPIDRFVTQLIMMEGSKNYGGPAGFGLATENDVPMAAKAHVIGRAFLGVEMGCARCHDAPGSDILQKDLFGLAAMLKRAPEKVPATSSVPVSPERLAAMAIKVTLKPGTSVPPAWPFEDLVNTAAAADVAEGDSRAQVAALVTSPANPRFAKVIVNRLWARYFGRGLIDDADDWDGEEPSHPALLDWLARELVLRDYSLEDVARVIFSSHTYGRGLPEADAEDGLPRPELFAGRTPRRFTAEQVLDSLAVASGKPFDVEPMNIDIDTSRPVTLSLNLGRPTRAWQFTTLGNERDRPSLSLPFAQHSVSLMEAFGWRGERQNPVTDRETAANALQPAILANGVAVKRACQFSESSGFTAAALEERPVEAFVDDLFLRILSRRPNPRERAAAVAIVAPGYPARRVAEDRAVVVAPEPRAIGVSWSNHLTNEADEAKRELARIAALGDPRTGRLEADWRERAEDLVWSLFNTPEFIFTP
jgi:hypothetical protein